MRYVTGLSVAAVLITAAGAAVAGEPHHHHHDDDHDHHHHHHHYLDHHPDHYGSSAYFHFSLSPYRHYSSFASVTGYAVPGTYWWSGMYRPSPWIGSVYHYYEPPRRGYYHPHAAYMQYYLPPLAVPGNAFGYGLGSYSHLMGYDRRLQHLRNLWQAQLWQQQLSRQQAVQNAANNRAANAANVAGPEAGPPVAGSNEAARERSRRFIALGDELFAQQRYHEAIQRYRSAQEAAEDLAEPYFREAHARTATGRYDVALEKLRRAIELAPDLVRDGFSLETLYGSSQLAKRSHLEALAQKALEEPQNADVLILLGAFLYYDGQAERAANIFARASELGGDDPHLQRFLAAEPAAAEGGLAL